MNPQTFIVRAVIHVIFKIAMILGLGISEIP